MFRIRRDVVAGDGRSVGAGPGTVDAHEDDVSAPFPGRSSLSPSLSETGKRSITRLDADGPTGHTEYATGVEAVRDAVRE